MEKILGRIRTQTRVMGPLMVARVMGEGLMVDQKEIVVVWVTTEAQAKADHRPWTVAGTIARVTRRLCLPSVCLFATAPPLPPAQGGWNKGEETGHSWECGLELYKKKSKVRKP